VNSIHGKHFHNVLLSAALTRILRGKLCDELMAGRTSSSFEKDETLFDAGEKNESVFFLQSGMVKVGMVTERGREIIYDLRKAGDVAGELCLCGAERRTDRAVALEPTKAVPVRYVEILAALRANADLLPCLLELFCQALTDAYERAYRLAVDPLDRRVIKVLLDLASKHGRPVRGKIEIPIHLTQEEISQMVNGRRERVSTSLHSLQRRGVIQYSRYGYMTADIEALRRS
jgi:CRP/FNR family cyclic AMP-dependent transcriptional regulator